MHIRNNIRNYLTDSNDLICIYDDKIYLYKYIKLGHFSKNTIEISMQNKNITIYGDNLIISKMTNNESLIIGNVKKIEFCDKNE